MERYKNIAGNSGVIAYELRKEAIAVRFKNGATYLYNYKTPGKESVERMKTLALSGKGLSTFISQHVRENYAAELQA